MIKKVFYGILATVLTLAGMPISAKAEGNSLETELVAEIYNGTELLKQTNNFEEAWNEANAQAKAVGKDNTITIKLLDDWFAEGGKFLSSSDGAFNVNENCNIEVDLNGHIISRELKKPQEYGNIFTVHSGSTLKLSDSDPLAVHYGYSVCGGILTGGSSTEVSGCIDIHDGGNLVMNGGAICSCYTQNGGAAIRMQNSGTITTNGTGFFYNVDNDDGGGAIYCENGTVNMKDTIFEGNYSTYYGGAIRIENCNFDAYNCIFRSNKTKSYGGSIWIDDSATKVKIDCCTFTECRADDDGGAIYVNNCEYAFLMNSIFSKNSAGDQSGAIHVDCDHVVLDSTTVIENTAKNKGGAIFVNDLNDLGVQGRTIVRDNHLENGKDDNIVLEWTTAFSKAFINNGGLYEGSEIHLHSDTFGTTKAANNISMVQAQYFFADNGSITQDSFENRKEKFVSSVIGEGNVIFVLTCLMLSIVSISIIMIFKKHKQKEEKS